MFLAFVRATSNSLDTHNLLTSRFPLCVSGRCGHGSPCEQLCYELHDGMYECDCRDGYILHKNGYSCAGECESISTPYPTLQFAFMAGDIFDFPNKISHRAAARRNFLMRRPYCFLRAAPPTVGSSRLISDELSRTSFIPEVSSSATARIVLSSLNCR